MNAAAPPAEPLPPRRASTRVLDVDLDGMLLCWNGDGPSIVRIIGGPLAVVVFSTPELLAAGVAALGIPFTKPMRIDDGVEFYTGVEGSAPEVAVIIDPYLTSEGKMRYLQALAVTP